ncbi:MAG: gluconate 2-dehydrogenase subunit 3 family protein [Lewinellaceae bacterium]|nr:gluconate 2-dehydrogenase subunit 3 family protein [Saprospiraceae bacterium]MCB9341382.1 gluconate 2-dehydrogenase subunit 3 family protein [Lewinellaceae bacterium]
MKRRHAIKNILAISAGAALLPSCETDANLPVYENIPLDKKQRQLIAQLADAILPKGKTQVNTPEETTDFILTVFNDNKPLEDIQKYTTGLTEFQTYLKEKYSTDFSKINKEKQAEILSYIMGENGPTGNVKYFYENTRDLAIEQFMSSEFFLKNVMEWEFAPGRFVGCVAV